LITYLTSKSKSFIVTQLTYRDRQIKLENVLLDTGSAGSISPTDRLSTIGCEYEADDFVYRIRGVGGEEFVFAKRLDRVALGNLQVEDFEIEIGLMNYGFKIDGILGMDFLTKVGAILDLERLEVVEKH
jgi:predicted aspartyl protease